MAHNNSQVSRGSSRNANSPNAPSVKYLKDNGREFKFQSNESVMKRPSADPEEFLPLIIRGDSQGVIDYLINFPDIVNIKDKIHGNIGIHIAASKGYTQMLQVLLARGSNVNTPDIFGNTALHYAVDHSKLDCVKILLNNFAVINKQDYRGNTALHIACMNNDIEAVKLLLAHNADPEVKDHSDHVPMDKTTMPSIKVLLERQIALIHGGAQEHVTQTVNWMTMGIGLGVGMGLALAKQQQYFIEQERARQEEAERIRKKLLQEQQQKERENQQAIVARRSSVADAGGRKLL